MYDKMTDDSGFFNTSKKKKISIHDIDLAVSTMIIPQR